MRAGVESAFAPRLPADRGSAFRRTRRYPWQSLRRCIGRTIRDWPCLYRHSPLKFRRCCCCWPHSQVSYCCRKQDLARSERRWRFSRPKCGLGRSELSDQGPVQCGGRSDSWHDRENQQDCATRYALLQGRLLALRLVGEKSPAAGHIVAVD